VSFYFRRHLLRLDNETVFRIDKQHCRKDAVHERSWEELMRGVVVGTGKCLDEVGQRLSTMLTRLFTSRDLQESKARLEEAQRVAHVGYWVWNLDTDRATWSDETYRIFGLKPQEGPIDLATVREMIHPEDRESVFRTAEEAVLGGVRPDSEHRLVRPSGEVRTVHSQGEGTSSAAASVVDPTSAMVVFTNGIGLDISIT
jgi:PAS domain-containing protein